uniref:ANK_REP_REGION domain-containing protein n=1 Tax=Caenorhabditis japonica TaxID=281687 RepID=A0A8R1I1F7_CAEJA
MNRVMECFEILKAGEITLRGLKTNLRAITKNHDFIAFFNRSNLILKHSKPVKILAATVNLMSLFSNLNTTVKRIDNTMKGINEQLTRSAIFFNELSKQASIYDAMNAILSFKPDPAGITLQQESLDKTFPDTNALKQLYINLETKWMKNVIEISVGKNGAKKVKRALDPLIKYTDRVIQISTFFDKYYGENWIEAFTNIFFVFRKIFQLEKWLDIQKANGGFAVPPDSYEPFLKCVTKLPQLPDSVNQEMFMKLMRKTKEFYEQVEQWLGLSPIYSADWFISFVDHQHTSVVEFLENTMHDEKNKDNIERELDKMQHEFLTTEGEYYLKEAYSFVSDDIKTMEKLFESGFLQNLRNHPDISLFTKTIDKIRGNEIFPLINCYSKEKATFQSLSSIISGASEFKEFSELNAKIVSLFEFLDHFSLSQKRVEDLQEFIKSLRTDGALSQDTKKMIKFGSGGNVASRFWACLKPLESILSLSENQALLDSLVSQEVDENNGGFARRWSKSYRNRTLQLLKDMKAVEDVSQKNVNGEDGLNGVFEMLTQASKMQGLFIHWKGVEALKIPSFEDLKNIAAWNSLHFSSNSEQFKSAAFDVTTLREFLESLKDPIILHAKFPLFTVLLIIGAVLAIIFLLLVVGFFLTPNGRNRWRKLYLSRWGSDEDLEQCWRYSFWTDQVSNKNMLCEAVREINYDHVKVLVEKGAYINPYNHFGNTPLHAATKYGHVKIVEILLKNGADREAYNTDNRTPEQMNEVAVNNFTSSELNSAHGAPNQSKRNDAIERLYRKYDDMTFKPRIPDLLPTMAYHVKIDSKITNRAVQDFTETFKGIVTDQITGVTHLVVPTNLYGDLITDDFNYIMCVFLPTILMQAQWLGACLDNKSNLRNDYKWRVQNVKYMGTVYKTVVEWARWVHKQCIPYLLGVQFYMTDDAHSDPSVVNQLKPLVEMHGATLCDELPAKENYNPGSHPFHHFHMGPLFVIHSDKDNQFEYLRNDGMFTLMTIHQFIVFMLEMQVKYDPERKHPIPVKADNFSTFRATTSKM